jgi:putative transposase
MTRTSYPTDLTDPQWSLIEPMIPLDFTGAGGGRPREVDMRAVFNGILYINRTGCAWRLLPRDFGNWNTVYYYFRRFEEDGTWQRIHDKLREKVRRKAGKLPTPSAGVIDAQSIKTAAPQKGARTATTRAKKCSAASDTSASIRSA